MEELAREVAEAAIAKEEEGSVIYFVKRGKVVAI
jgi:hypothetical protein